MSAESQRPGAAGGGDSADPNELPCAACGHVWFAGERRHQWCDPEPGAPGEAQVLCALCLRQRRISPAERRPTHWRWGAPL
jgi:hypothetical protein